MFQVEVCSVATFILTLDRFHRQSASCASIKGAAEEDVMGAAAQLDAAVAFPTNRKSAALTNDITSTQFPSDSASTFQTLTSSPDG